MCMPQEASNVVAFYSRNKEFFRPYFPSFREGFFTEELWRKRLSVNIEDFNSGINMKLFFHLNENPETIIGQISFNDIVRGAAHYCSLGYAIDKEEEGRGLMTEALEVSIKYAFSQLNLHRIQANYIPTNERSARVLRKLGFVVEGYAYDYLCLDGEWKDHILTSLTNKNWKSPK